MDAISLDDSQQPEPIREPRALVLAEVLGDHLGFKGPGRVELEFDQRGRCVTIWKHEKTPAGSLGRFDGD